MKLLRLYMENFHCHEISELDFTNFQSVVIVGKIGNNDHYSNGTGKSTIFKAIEYVLFNKARETQLEKLVRNDTTKCKVILDFLLNDKTYRIIRTRTIKGLSDLSLFQLNSTDISANSFHLSDEQTKLYWNNLTGRRTADTEEDLKKLLKINFEAFLSSNHFVQNDFSGLPTATAGQRKKLLKEALQLSIYNKLEKLTSEEIKPIFKDLEKKKTALSLLGDPQKDSADISTKISNQNILINNQTIINEDKKIQIEDVSFNISELSSKFSSLDANSSSLIKKKSDIVNKINKLTLSLDEADQKRKSAAQIGKELINEQKILKNKQKELDIDYSNSFKEDILKLREQITTNQAIINNLKNELIDLKIPLPDDSLCKHCRQPLTDAHRQVCKNQIQQEITDKENKIIQLSNESIALTNQLKLAESKLLSIEFSQKQLLSINAKIDQKTVEISEKLKIHDEYNSIFKNLKQELINSQEELKQIKQEVNSSSEEELSKLRNQIIDQRSKLNSLKKDYEFSNAILNKLTNEKAVLTFSYDEKQKDILKKSELLNEIENLTSNYSIYLDVLEAFGSKGIPNLIVQNILDELQMEANNLLSQLKPGLQLSFAIEKTKGDGEIDDDLEINYFLNGKSRDYGQLSGAQKLCVLFSLKLGLSFLLQKKLNVQINFLLIDEIDQCLDKAGIDAFADIIKFFQKDFIILIITHNDRLKDKFPHSIIVEQNQNLVSRAYIK